MSDPKKIDLALLFRKSPYRAGAYAFVLRALEYTIQRLPEGTRRHVSGQELLKGIRDFASECYGPLAAEVFRSWGIQKSMDFGRIVFDLVEKEILSKREQDSIEDFREGFDFEETFEKDYDYLRDFLVVHDSRFPHLSPKETASKPMDDGLSC